jgi:hypothetical protein
MESREIQRIVAAEVEKALGALDLVELFRDRVDLSVTAEPASLSPGVYGNEVDIGLRIDGVTYSSGKFFIPNASKK